MLQKMKKHLQNQKGLTLIELLAVVVILGIIAAIAVPSISNIIQNSRIEAVKTDASIILNAAKIQIAEEGAPAAGTTIVPSDLASYVEGVTTFTDSAAGADDAYTISVNANNEVELSGTGSKGGVNVTFAGATLAEIGSAAKGDTTIGN